MTRWYRRFGIAILILYAAAISFGWEFGAPARGEAIPANVRQQPGGYRSYLFWRGGK